MLTLGGPYNHYPHFTDKETEGERWRKLPKISDK